MVNKGDNQQRRSEYYEGVEKDQVIRVKGLSFVNCK